MVIHDQEDKDRDHSNKTFPLLVFPFAAPFNHPNTTITRVRHGSLTPKANEGKDGGNQMPQHNAPTGSTLLDTYLQFITENTFGEYK